MENEEYIEQDAVDQGQPSSRTLTQNAGSIKQQISNGVSTAAKATRGLGNAEKAAAVAAKASAKALKAGGKAVEAGGKAVEAGGKGIESGGNAAGQALSAIPYVGGVLGGIVKGASTAVGKGTQATGKGMQYAGKGMQKGGDALDKSSKKLDAKSKVHKNAAKKLDDVSKKIDNANFGGNEQDKAKSAAGQAASKTGKFLKDKLKDLINPADPDRLLNKAIKTTCIFIGVVLFFVLLMYAHISELSTEETTKSITELEDNISCEGNIKLELLGKLEPPVALTEGQLITFDADSNFGYVDYYFHNGVDLTEKSTNTKPGDPVYSVYSDGEVIASTYDDTYPDKKVIGGWIKIRYLMTIDKNNYDFTITYGNIDKSSLKLKTGDKVDKKQEIGKVGTSADTEFGKEPGVHFGFYDNLSKRTLNPVNLFVPCYREEGEGDGLKLHDVEISRSDFIKATQNYLNSYSGICNSMKDWNIGDVYDISSKNNLNPEFVVIRAIEEGCSPVSKGYTSKNNYWGLGCYNGKPLSTCSSYSSFESGVSGLANLEIVKKSNTVVELMYDYAYLGNVWLNPGGSGSGGCYYKDYVLPYISDPSRRAAIREACESGNKCSGSESTCLKTKDGIYDDQKAYAQYNSKSMNELFNKIYSEYHY